MQCSRLTPHALRLTPYASRKNYSTGRGFTLNEMLVALAILGLIAGFVVPKVINGIENQQKRAILKEVISDLTSLCMTEWLQGSLKPSTSPYQLLKEKFNCTQYADNASSAGLWVAPLHGDSTRAGCLLPNGAVIIMDPSANGVNTFGVDWNGSKSPNADYIGVNGDRLLLRFNNQATGTPPWTVHGNNLLAGQLKPDTGSVAFYNWVFQ